MSSNPLVSVVIPVYNVEQYIDECVGSVIKQSYENIEIILVDDAAMDGSGQKCEMWQKRDRRIKIVHKQKNEGLNMARMTGFDASHGKYITFLDSDDCFHQDNIENSLRALIDNKAEIAIYATKEFSDHDTKTCVTDANRYEERLITGKKHIAQYAFFGDGNISGIKHMTVWGKLYTRSVIEHIDWRAANYRAYEDSFWTPQALLMSSRIVLMSASLIYYRRNVAYGVLGNNLGNKLTGNSINGKAVGYLEYLELQQEFYCDLARKYGLESKLDEQIHQYILLSKTWRIDNLVKAGLLESENNLEYVLKVLPKYIEAKNRHIENLGADITRLGNSLIESNQNLTKATADLTKATADLAHFNKTLEEYSGVRRSAKLFAGNIKRKFIKFRD